MTGQMTAVTTNSEMEKKNGRRVLVANFKKTVQWEDLGVDGEYYNGLHSSGTEQDNCWAVVNTIINL